MKKIAFLFGSLAVVALSANAQFTPGNLAVLRVGDGSAALTSVSTSGFIDQYTTIGGYVNTVTIPDSAGNSPLTWSGSATSEGALTRSSDGGYLTIVGYNTAKGLAAVAGTTSAAVPRSIATVNASGTYALAATTTSAFSANNIRSGVTDGANNFWGAGANSGTYYFGTASAAGTVQSVNANTRVLNIFNGNLYFSTGSGTRGIYTMTGLPTGSATPTALFATGASSSPYDFAINAAGTLAYVADDSSNATGGIQRWDFSAGAWSLTYTLGTGVANIGARGLAVDFSGPNAVLYATTGEGTLNRLIALTDTGSGSTPTTLATAGVNQIFRGVDFAPIPEPSTVALGAFALAVIAGLRRRNNT